MQATEVFVIGGGPAGLAVALAARRRGLEVMLADGARPPIDKACGEGLMPDGSAALSDLGVSLGSADAQPFRGIRFVGSAACVEAAFPLGSGMGVRRTALHARMVASAERAGVRMCWGTPVSGLTSNIVRLAGTTVAARWVIGADGFDSRVRRWAGLDAGSVGRLRFGFRIQYRREPWTDYMELHWGRGCQIYVTPVSPSEVCVALVSRDPHLRLEQALQGFPRLRARLADAPHGTLERGAVTANCSLPRVYRGRVALVGDASGSVDAITGEGLCLAFRQALALADALAAGDLKPYQAAHRRLALRPILMSRLLLAMDRQAWLREGALRAMAFEPRIFRKMLSVHVAAGHLSQGAASCALPA